MPEANPMLESEEASFLWFYVKLSFASSLYLSNSHEFHPFLVVKIETIGQFAQPRLSTHNCNTTHESSPQANVY